MDGLMVCRLAPHPDEALKSNMSLFTDQMQIASLSSWDLLYIPGP